MRDLELRSSPSHKKLRKNTKKKVKEKPLELTPVEALEVPQATEVVTVLPAASFEKPNRSESESLVTQDLIRPNEKLRLSIEAFLLDQRSPHTRLAYSKDLKRFVKFLLSRGFQQGVEALNRMVLIAYKESLIQEGLEHTTIDRHLATLKSFFGWLVDDGILSKSPAQGVRFLNPKKLSSTNGFSDEEVRKLLAVPNLHTKVGAMHYAILMVLFYCGLRRSELCALEGGNIGIERGQRYLKLRGKGNAERIIVLIEPVWNAIRYYYHIAQRDLQNEVPLFIPIRNNRTGVLNKPLDSSMIYYIVTRYAKKAGIQTRVSPHSCRATAISNARDHNVPDRAIQEFAGWASLDMITRYDKRKTAILSSAAFGISYGNESKPVTPSFDLDLASKAGGAVLQPSSEGERCETLGESQGKIPDQEP